MDICPNIHAAVTEPSRGADALKAGTVEVRKRVPRSGSFARLFAAVGTDTIAQLLAQVNASRKFSGLLRPLSCDCHVRGNAARAPICGCSAIHRCDGSRFQPHRNHTLLDQERPPRGTIRRTTHSRSARDAPLSLCTGSTSNCCAISSRNLSSAIRSDERVKLSF